VSVQQIHKYWPLLFPFPWVSGKNPLFHKSFQATALVIGDLKSSGLSALFTPNRICETSPEIE
jgi:hypothetical protein